MKNFEFIIVEETSLLGFETEQVYKICFKGTTKRICNVHQDKQGVFCVSSVYYIDIDVLTEALKFAKGKIK